MIHVFTIIFITPMELSKITSAWLGGRASDADRGEGQTKWWQLRTWFLYRIIIQKNSQNCCLLLTGGGIITKKMVTSFTTARSRRRRKTICLKYDITLLLPLMKPEIKKSYLHFYIVGWVALTWGWCKSVDNLSKRLNHKSENSKL